MYLSAMCLYLQYFIEKQFVGKYTFVHMRSALHWENCFKTGEGNLNIKSQKY